MEQFRFSSDFTSSDSIPFDLTVQAILNGLPVAIRSQNHRGVQIEDGKVKSQNYTGPVPERVRAENNIKTWQGRKFTDVPVVVIRRTLNSRQWLQRRCRYHRNFLALADLMSQ